jgi:teichuronic acid biosynthesis glycosyltransferase TuaC
MNLLVVCSGNKKKINAFILEQVSALKLYNIEVAYFLIEGKGLTGYLSNIPKLLRAINQNNIDLIHAHYGLSGLLASLQRKIPVITTFHGSDINQKNTRKLSRLASRLSRHNIIVEKTFIDKINLKNDFTLLPCGVDLDTFHIIDKYEARNQLKWDTNEHIVLFSSAFNNPVKNYPLAKQASQTAGDVKLVELAGYNRQQINLLMNAADALLVTSFTEGSPQVVKEAMACNLPVVSVAVGDVPLLLEGVSESHIVEFEVHHIVYALQKILSGKRRSNGRTKILSYDNRSIAKKLINIYQSVLKNANA